MSNSSSSYIPSSPSNPFSDSPSVSDISTIAAPVAAPNLRNALLGFRLATPDDRGDLQCIEHTSRDRFRSLPMMTRIAERGPFPLEDFDGQIRIGGIFVATAHLGSDPSAGGTIVGFIHVVSPDDIVQEDIRKFIQSEFRRLFVSNVHVPVLYERQGVGRRLMRYVEELGKPHGVLAMDVVVFADVPWCRGFCESMGYSVRHWKELEDNPYGKYLLRIREEMEKDHVSEFGWVVMRKLL